MAKTRVLVVLMSMVSLAVVGVVPQLAGAAGPGPQPATGTYETPIGRSPIVAPDPDDPTKLLAQTSNSTNFGGTFTGSTQYFGTVTYDPVTKESEGNLVEVFTGTVADLGAGTVTFKEHFTQDATQLTLLDAAIVSATGPLRGLTGLLHFEGRSDAYGVGAGTYSGTIDTSQLDPEPVTTNVPLTASPTTPPAAPPAPALAPVTPAAYTG
ncbi:DUF3224 domain-containing protein [Aquihabitans sp. McL0605]|uniref:DUF3224 domain-containing protein n=1 Tax=Aquihabitans sp. McL0605 TaxID=3415671 RepID=UPI003CEC1F96